MSYKDGGTRWPVLSDPDADTSWGVE